MALPVGPVIPSVLQTWSFYGQFNVEGVLSNNFYSLAGGVNNLNTFAVSAKGSVRLFSSFSFEANFCFCHLDNSPVAMTRAGPGAFNSTLLWTFPNGGFVKGPQDPSLRALPTFCKPSCGPEIVFPTQILI
jgi:hypothetical protein